MDRLPEREGLPGYQGPLRQSDQEGTTPRYVVPWRGLTTGGVVSRRLAAAGGTGTSTVEDRRM